MDDPEQLKYGTVGLDQIEETRGADLLLQRLTQRGRLITAVQLAQGEIESADGAAKSDGLLDEPLHPRLVEALDQRAGEIGGGVSDDPEQLKHGAFGLNQVEKARGADLLLQRLTQRGRLVTAAQLAQG